MVRRVVVITAEIEKLPLGGRTLTNFLLEVRLLAILVATFGLAVYLLRRRAAAERAAEGRLAQPSGSPP